VAPRFAGQARRVSGKDTWSVSVDIGTLYRK
jgi:hypothetical protein